MRKPSKHLDHLALTIRAFIDVGLIILIFLIIAAKPKYLDPMNIQPPSSRAPLIDSYVNDGIIIYLGYDKVLLRLRMDDSVRGKILNNIGQKNMIGFTPKEIADFKRVGMVGSSVKSLRHYIDVYNKDEAFYNHVGVNLDSIASELPEWISESRKAYNLTPNENIRVYLFADRNESYKNIKRIFDFLGEQRINKFSLVVLK